MEHEHCINRQVKNNEAKFDIDFSFQLTKQEFDDLRCKNSTSSWNRLVYHTLIDGLICTLRLLYGVYVLYIVEVLRVSTDESVRNRENLKEWL